MFQGYVGKILGYTTKKTYTSEKKNIYPTHPPQKKNTHTKTPGFFLSSLTPYLHRLTRREAGGSIQGTSIMRILDPRNLREDLGGSLKGFPFWEILRGTLPIPSMGLVYLPTFGWFLW